MRHRPASDFIPNFDVPEAELAEVVDTITIAEPAPIELPAFLFKTPREPAPDLDAIFENGRQAGLEQARAEALTEMARLREEAAASLEAARRDWADQVASPLAVQIANALHELADSLSDTVGRLLRPFLDAELRDAAGRALIEQITPLLAGADGGLIRVSGPKILVTKLRAVFPPGHAVEFAESDATEVTVVAGGTVIETRIGAWTAKLEGRGPDRRRRISKAV